MRQILFLTWLLAAPMALAAPDCGQLLLAARAEQVAVPAWQAARRVTGKDRLHFHSAPERNCRLKDVFVVPGDQVQALQEYGIYTEVQYVHPRSGRVAVGWVESGRLDESLVGR